MSTTAKKRTKTHSSKQRHLPGGVSSAAVKNATGKSWEQWLRILDRAGCAKMIHKQIVAFLNENHDLGPWWQQMVTVGYEQARGLREKHQTVTGYSVSASRTLNTSAAGAFLWWKMNRCRKQWLGDADIAVHKATPSKSIRATWNASSSKPMKSISVNIYPKGKGKATMTIQHEKLDSAAAAKKMKAYWMARLNDLEQLVQQTASAT